MKQSRRGFVISALGVTTAGLASSREISTNLRNPAYKGAADFTFTPIYTNSQKSCCEINLARLRDGELVATFCQHEEGRETGDIRFARSRNSGRTWELGPVSTLFAAGENGAPGWGQQLAAITQLSDGSLISHTTRFQFLFEGSVGWRRGAEIEGIYIRKSGDSGHGWGEAIKVDFHPFRIAWARGSILEIGGGRLLMPLSGLRGGPYGELNEPIESFLLFSDDKGLTWKYQAIIATDHSGARDYDEPVIARLRDGRLLCMLRSHEKPRRDPPGGYLYKTVSEDGGLNWTRPEPTSLWGYPADLLTLHDGRVLCTFGYRMYPDPGVRACISDNGVDWKPENIFAIKRVPDLAPERLQIGSPRSVQLVDGSVFTAYQLWRHDRNSEWRQFIESALYQL